MYPHVLVAAYVCSLVLQVSELRLTSERAGRDKSSLMAELQAVKEELELNSFLGKGTAG